MAPLGKDSRGWFGSRHGSKHGESKTEKENKGLEVNVVSKPLLSQEDIELEYLNEISRLTREKEEVRDELEKQSRDHEAENSSLRESNESLQCKIAGLEEKLSQTTSVTQSISHDSKIDLEVGSLRAKLAKYNETNKALHTKIQRLKQKRKDGDDDYSEVSSVSSISRFSYLSTNHQAPENLSELQTKYDEQIAKNKELERKLQIAEVNKVNSEKLLGELRSESSDTLKKHQEETKQIQNDLHEAKQELIKLKSEQSSDEENQYLNKDLEKSQLKALDLEKEITEKNKQIESLELKLKANSELESKLESLQGEIEQYKKENDKKGELIETLRNEKEKNEQELRAIESDLKETKERETQMKIELDQLKAMQNVERSKSSETDSSQQNKQSQAKELKAALDNLQKRFTDEALLNATLKEELKNLQESKKKTEDSSQPSKSNDESSPSSESENISHEVIELKAQLKSKEVELTSINEKMETIEKQRDDASTSLQSVETTLAETKLKNALQMEELDSLKFDLQQLKKNTNNNVNSTGDNAKIAELEKTVNQKTLQIRVLEVKTRDAAELTEKVKKLEKDLEVKTKELEDVTTEKLDSTKRLETLELDFAVTQQKGAKTWEELEDLKEKYEIEQKIKSDLQGKLKKMDSVQQLVGETKRLSEASLKDRDKEIDKLKKQLTEANIAKGATEKKLIAHINDSAKQESSRDLMKQQLEEQLETENEKAMQLESLIVSKEESIEKIRAEFDLLIKSMEYEMQQKRNLVTELNGEVLEKANQLAMKDRDLQYLRGEMDDMQLRHDSEVIRLNKELDASVDKVELERLRHQNEDLEQTILTLNQEIGKLRAMFVNRPEDNSSEGTIKVLRERNEKLKKDLEKLSRKFYQLKKGRKEI